MSLPHIRSTDRPDDATAACHAQNLAAFVWLLNMAFAWLIVALVVVLPGAWFLATLFGP